jgi:hypothetical protein
LFEARDVRAGVLDREFKSTQTKIHSIAEYSVVTLTTRTAARELLKSVDSGSRREERRVR